MIEVSRIIGLGYVLIDVLIDFIGYLDEVIYFGTFNELFIVI